MDEQVKALQQRLIADRAGAFIIGLGYLGDKLGLFEAMAGAGALTSTELARRTGLDERYVREWLRAMAAAEYIDCDPAGERYTLTDAQAAVLAYDDGRTYLGGAFQLPIASLRHMPRFLEVFRHGGGLSYAELGEEIAESHDRVHKPPFEHQLAQEWLPGIPGLEARLAKGIRVLDVGCGLGRSTVAMARAFPNCTIHGLEPDPVSARRARAMAAEAEAANIEFLEVPVAGLPADVHYDFILAFDCIHDMADPVAALRRIRDALAGDGQFVWVELIASANPVENRTPIGRMIAGISLFHCMTVSLAQGGLGLGNMLGEAGARKLAEAAGFTHFERAPIDNPLQQFFVLQR